MTISLETNFYSTCIIMTMASRVYAVWLLVFLVVVSLAVLSYYAENDKAYSTAQLPSTWTSSSGSSTSARSLALVSLLALLALLGMAMVTLIAAVAIKRRRIEIEDAYPPGGADGLDMGPD